MTDTVLLEQGRGPDDRAGGQAAGMSVLDARRLVSLGYVAVAALFFLSSIARFPRGLSRMPGPLLFTVVGLLVVVAALVAGIRARTLERRFWLLLAATSGFLLAGQVYFAVYVALVGPEGPPAASVSDLFNVAGIVAFVVLLAKMTRFAHASPAVRTRYVADVAAVGLVAGVAVYAWVVGPWFDTLARVTLAAKLTSSAYPLVGGAVLWGILDSLNGTRFDRWQSWERLVGAGMGLFAAGCVLYPLWMANHIGDVSPLGAGAVEFVWLSGLYIVFAGTVLRQVGPQVAWRLGPLPVVEPSHGWLPSVVMPAIEIMAIPAFGVAAYQSEDPQRVVFGTVAAVISVLLAARTGLTVLDNGRLLTHAVTDPLTGLFNHRHFHQRLTEGVAGAARFGEHYSVIVLDVDDFSRFNAAGGHVAGDRSLVEVARRVERAVRGHDIVCRIGGDEIGILLADTGVEAALSLAGRVLGGVRTYPGPGGRPTTASIGIATYPIHAQSRDELVRHADGAQYWAKYHGKNRVVVYDPAVVVALDAEARIRAMQQQAHLDSVRTLAAAVDARDTATRDHSHNVGAMASRLAREVGLDENKAVMLELAGTLHDVGKIGLPDSILRKTVPLTQEEWQRVREHPALGERIIASTRLNEMLPWVRHHHERWDGSGYPDGLAGEAIPPGARILALCDAYDAMAFDRPYRPAMSHEAALQEIDLHLGTQFDPVIGEVFIRLAGHDRWGSR